MQQIDYAGLEELRLGQGRSNAQNRFVREEHGAFRHGVDITAETEFGEVLEHLTSKAPAPFQPIEILGGEAQILQEVEYPLQACRNEKPALSRQLANEEFENRDLRLSMVQIRLDPVQLVEVGEQCAGCGIHRGVRPGS